MAKELKIRITGDSSGLKKGVDESEGILKGFGGKVSAFSVATGTLLAQGIATGLGAAAGLIGSSISSAGDLNESVSKTEQLFGDGSEAIMQFAETAATQLGQTKQQALDAASNFATFGKAAGLAGEDLNRFATTNTALASDLASFYNSSPEEAAEALGAAFRGEAEPIRKYGVMLDAASIKAKAVSLGLVEAKGDTLAISRANETAEKAQRKYNESVTKFGEGSTQANDAARDLEQAQLSLAKATEGTVPELTQQQKTLAAQQLIMEQTADAQGDFEKTSGGLANQQRILAAQFENLKTSIGQAFLPVVLKLVATFNEHVMPVLQKFGPLISKELVGGFRALFASFRDFNNGLTSSGFAGVMERIGIAAGKTVQWFKDLAKVFQDSGWKGALASIGTDLGQLAVTIGVWFNDVILPAVGGWLLELGKKFGSWVTDTAVPYLLAHLPDWITAFYGWYYGTALPWLGEQVWELAKKLGQEWIPAAAEYLGTNLPIWLDKLDVWFINTALPWLGEKSLELARKLADWVLDAANYLVQNLPVWIGRMEKWFLLEGLPKVLQIGGDIATKLLEGVGDLAVNFLQIGVDLVQGLIDGIWSMAGTLKTEVESFITANIPGPVKSLLGISSPSKVMEKFGLQTAQGLAVGMTAGGGMVAGAAASLARQAIPGYTPAELSGGSTVGSMTPGMSWQSSDRAIVIEMADREVGRGLYRANQLNERARR